MNGEALKWTYFFAVAINKRGRIEFLGCATLQLEYDTKPMKKHKFNDTMNIKSKQIEVKNRRKREREPYGVYLFAVQIVQ